MGKNYVILIMICLMPIYSLAQQVQLKGSVCDENNIPLVGAVVMLLRDSIRISVSTCDLNGIFTISEKLQGTEILCVSFVGYRTREIPIADVIHLKHILIILQEETVQLESITIKGFSISEEFAVKHLEAMDIFLSPTSSADPLKAISTLPASTNVSESANVELRGSAIDRSIVMLNGVPIWKPVRNTQLNGLGNFSMFNTELIGKMRIYAGNPPLTFGNSIAGTVEIETPKILQSDDVKLSFSLANLGVLLNKSIADNDFIQLYTNYQFSPLYLGLNSKNIDFLKQFNSIDCGMNLHLNLTPRLKFNLYDYVIKEYYRADTEQYSYRDESRATSKRWFQVTDLTFISSKKNVIVDFNNGIDICRSGYKFGNMDCNMWETRLYSALTSKYIVGNFSFQIGFSHFYSRVKANGLFPKYFFDYSKESPCIEKNNTLSNHSFETFLYCKYVPFRNLLFSSAIRKNISTKNQVSYISWQCSGRWNIKPYLSCLLSCGEYHAYNIPTYNNLNFALHSSQQYSFDLVSQLDKYNISFSAYIKNEQTLDYFTEKGEDIENKRKIRGIEFSVARSFKRFSIEGAYTFIDSHFNIKENKYVANNSLNYIIRTSVVYRTPRMLSIAVNFCTHPGLRYTPVKDAIHLSEKVWMPLYGEYNSDRVGVYHSLDLTINKVYQLGKIQLVSFVTITNVLNENNRKYPVYQTDYSNIKYWENYQKRLVYCGLQWSF